MCPRGAAEDVCPASAQGLPPPGSAWGAGKTLCTTHVLGRQEALPGKLGSVPAPKRLCQLSATSLLPPNLQPWQDWLRQPHIRDKRLLTEDAVLSNALGSRLLRLEPPAAATAGEQGGDVAASWGDHLRTPPPAAPPTPVHPSCLFSLSPKHCWESSPFLPCPDVASAGLRLWPYWGARSGVRARQEPPAAVGTLPSLLFNGM